MRKIPGSVMLYAAGFGTRMGTLTAHIPKPMIEVAGKPLIDHALEHVNAYGPKRIVTNLHYKPQALESHLGNTGIIFSHESPDILETGGGLRAALPLLGADPLFTMNTDAVWLGPNPLDQLSEAWKPEQMDALLLCIPASCALGHTGPGDFIIDDNGTAKRGPGLIYSGLQIIKTERLHGIPHSSFSLHMLWEQMLKTNRLHATVYPGKWCDVGTPEAVTIAEDMLGYRHV